MTGVPIRAAAKALGLAHTSLIRARDRGRCTFNEDGSVDVELVRRQLARNTDTTKPRNHLTGNQGGRSAAASVEPTGISRAREEKADYEAKLARLEYEERAGLTVSVEEVTRAASAKVRRTRDLLLAIPDRIDAILAAETDTARCNAIVRDEIDQALGELSGGVTG